MFALRRSSYHQIQEEDPQQLNALEEADPPPCTAATQPNFACGDSMAPPRGGLHHQQEVAVSFKCEKDPEMSSLKQAQGAQWDHVGDVDQFFSFVYEYYQHKGFLCIALRYIFSLFRFAFVVLFSTFLLQCVDYDVLFYNRNVTLQGTPLPAKRRIQDAFIPQCHSHFNPLVTLALFLAVLFWLGHFFRICCRLIQFREIKQFFVSQLQIHDGDMQNMSWNQVLRRLCQAQRRIHLIVNRDAISSLDIYQRILRHRNYFVAFVYKSLLPLRINFPVAGPVHYLSSGLRFNMEWLLFWGPWSPWKSSYALKDEFKEKDNLERIAQSMRRTLTIMSIVNLLFFPFVFVYQVLFSFFSYSELFQRDPNTLGMRKYSNYGREKLRHFNEMDHELDARLNRSYEFAVRYTDQFISPLAKIIAKSVAFVAASVFVVLCALTAFDEDTLKIEHVTTLLTCTGAIVLACRVFIPNEHLVFCQQLLMRQIVANIHYAPKSWLSNAHSTEVYAEFTQIFRLKAQLLAEELASPLLTPFILYFCIRPRAKEIVAFIQKYTVHVEGLGDVCSLAQMDIARDGDARLASLNQSMIVQGALDSKGRQRDACGKVELSLLNFATLNPDWTPSKECAEFIRNVKDLVAHEISVATRSQQSDDSGSEYSTDQQQQNSFIDAQTLALLQASTHASLRQMEQSHRCVISDIFPAGSMLQSSSLGTYNQQQDLARTATLPEENNKENAADKQRGTEEEAPLPAPLAASIRPANASVERSQTGTAATHRQQSPLAFTNSQLVASSFIQPSPLAAIVQPRVIQESNFRAMEMSMHALAVNQLLFITNNQQQPSAGAEQHFHSSARPPMHRTRGGYGSILLQGSGINRRGGGPLVMDSLAGSNIFGVPAGASQIQLSDGDNPRQADGLGGAEDQQIL